MSKTSTTSATEESNPLRSQSKLSAALLTATEQLPKQLHPRRNQHSWSVFRFALGVFGAALVILPLALPQSWIAAIFGLGFFLTAILLPPVLNGPIEETQALESNRQIILKGAAFSASFAAPEPVQLFVNSEQILAMKPNLQPAVVLRTADVSSLFLQRSGNCWLLVLQWAGKESEFSFHGLFAERNARKAEAALRSLVRTAAPEKPKARAAGA
ncbi:MAG TPA: hypothetical protein VN025_11245 [Candidatus Dormibacteraeota bacterium]|jgi:hypothetical protein|nr:hypothetical protein [Candidatus Dormibacteraeota bacterium]